MTPMKTRSRYFSPIKLGRSYYEQQDYSDAVTKTGHHVIWDNTDMLSVGGRQETTSQGNPWKRGKSSVSEGDIGGPFSTTKRYYDYKAGASQTYHVANGPLGPHDSWQEQFLTCHLFPISPYVLNWPPIQSSSDAELNKIGASTSALVEPTNSLANLSTFLGELLKDGFPSIPGIRLWEERILLAVKAGDEFLNVVFGWLPLLSDVHQAADALQRATKILQQFERDAGKVVRRKYRYEPVRTEETVLYASNVTPWYGSSAGSIGEIFGRGNVYRTRKTVRSVWFSAAYTYHLSRSMLGLDGLEGAATEAKKVFGLELTPEVLWNLAPWSWAIDWFSNAGDVIHNISALTQYGLVMKYGYIMESVETRDIYTWEQTSTGSTGMKTVVPPFEMVCKTKLRRQANPFGFGVSWDGLNDLQRAILAALGITRLL